MFGLLGPNGAGKTTTVEILEGYRERSDGEVTVLGFDPGQRVRAFRARVGIVLQTTGLYRLLRQGGIHLRLASQTIGARSARPREARLLKVPAGAPLLTMQRISYDDAGQPVEYGSHVYPAERYSFEMSVVADSRT